MRIILIITFISVINIVSYSQSKVVIADFQLVNGDTVFFADIPEVEILDFKDNTERILYFILKKRVFKTYHYALLAKAKLESIQYTPPPSSSAELPFIVTLSIVGLD